MPTRLVRDARQLRFDRIALVTPTSRVIVLREHHLDGPLAMATRDDGEHLEIGGGAVDHPEGHADRPIRTAGAVGRHDDPGARTGCAWSDCASIRSFRRWRQLCLSWWGRRPEQSSHDNPPG